MLYNSHNLNVRKIVAGTSAPAELQSVFFTETKTVATDRYRLLEITVPKVDMDKLSSPDNGGFTTLDGATKHYMRGHKPFLISALALEGIKLKEDRHAGEAGKHLSAIGVSHLDDKKVEMLMFNGVGAEVKTLPRVNEKFPDYEKIIPTGKPLAEVVLNAKLLRELLAIMEKLGEQVKFQVFGEEQPVILTCSNGEQDARGIIMPIRE